MAALIGLAVIILVTVALMIIFPAWRGISRRHENLPAVAIEGQNNVYCRMAYCDFRFPLPADGHAVSTSAVTGGSDTTNGVVYVTGTNGHSVQMRAYAELLQSKHFVSRPTDGTGCGQVTNRMSDHPFISGGVVIHYPLFDEFSAGSVDQQGGLIEVKSEGGLTKITFSYFGDF